MCVSFVQGLEVIRLERIIRHAYLLGASTRGPARLAEQIYGGSLMHWFDDRVFFWRNQPIEPIYPVVYIDGMHVDMVGSDRTVMLVSGMCEDGILQVLGFCISTGESRFIGIASC